QRADDLAVNVDGAATHAGDDAVLLDAGALDESEDHRTSGESALFDAQDFYFVSVEFESMDDAERFALHPRLPCGKRHDIVRQAPGFDRDRADKAEDRDGQEPDQIHPFHAFGNPLRDGAVPARFGCPPSDAAVPPFHPPEGPYAR